MWVADTAASQGHSGHARGRRQPACEGGERGCAECLGQQHGEAERSEREDLVRAKVQSQGQWLEGRVRVTARARARVGVKVRHRLRLRRRGSVSG